MKTKQENKQRQTKLKRFFRTEILNGNTNALDWLINDYIDSNLAFGVSGGDDDDSALLELEILAEDFLGYEKHKSKSK